MEEVGKNLFKYTLQNDESITLQDINAFDDGILEKYNFLTNAALKKEKFEETFNDCWVAQLSDGSFTDLITNGKDTKVEFEDRFKYAELYLHTRINEMNSQLKQLKAGISKIIPGSILKLFTIQELERLVCGSKSVDVELLKRNTEYIGDINSKSARVQWLWEIVSEMSEEEKVKLVKFCWAQERLPATQEEYDKLQIRFKIKPAMDSKSTNHFPTADTCFFNLELPNYSSKEQMKIKLLQAIILDNVSINNDKPNVDVSISQTNFDRGRGFRGVYAENDDEDYY